MRLSELYPSLNSDLQNIVLSINRREGPVHPGVAARLLGYSSRRFLDRKCERGDLDETNRPTRRIPKISLLIFLLSKHGFENIEIDSLNIHPD